MHLNARRPSQTRKARIPKGAIPVSHPNSRTTQKALAAKKESANLNALKEKLTNNLANMTHHDVKLKSLARETLTEFLKMYFEIKDRYGDIRGNELEDLMWDMLDHSDVNTDALARASLKKFVTILTKIINKHSYAIHYKDKLENLMWKKMSFNHNNKQVLFNSLNGK
jgi:hypothetical protein